MSQVVGMLEGKNSIPDIIHQQRSHSQDLRFKSMREVDSQSSVGSKADYPSSVGLSSNSGQDLSQVNEESYLGYKAVNNVQSTSTA